MATETIFVIDPAGTGDYTSLAAYVTGEAANLVSTDVWHHVKCKRGDIGPLTIEGVGTDFTLDATHYILIEPYDDTYKFDEDWTSAGIQNAVTGTPHIIINGVNVVGICQYVTIQNIAIFVDSGIASPAVDNSGLIQNSIISGDSLAAVTITRAGTTGRFANCYIDNDNDIDGCILCFSSADEGYVFCTIVEKDENNHNVWCARSNSGASFVNCVIVRNADSAYQKAVYGDGEYINCYCSDDSLDEIPAERQTGCKGNLSGLLDSSRNDRLANSSPARRAGKYIADVPDDAFDTDRIRPDLGWKQTAYVNDYDIEQVFTEIGQLLKRKTLAEKGVYQSISDLTGEALTTFIESRRDFLQTLMGEDASNQSQLESWGQSYARMIEDYITTYVSDLVDSGGTSELSVILDELDYWMGQNSEYIKACETDYSIVYRLDGGTSLTIGSITVPEIIAPQKITIECTNADTSGEEVWTVTGSKYGSFAGTAETGTAYTDDNTGLAFTITATADPSVGDKIYLYVSAEEGVFQSFMRDNYGFVFSSAKDDGTETIEDSLAAA